MGSIIARLGDIMKILIAGSTGYVGRRLIPRLLEDGHHLVLLTRGLGRIPVPPHQKNHVQEIQIDLLEPGFIFPSDIEAAYYLVHSMKSGPAFVDEEKKSAENFISALKKTAAKQVIFLSGISNAKNLSEHIQSRLHVEEVFKQSSIPVTILKAGIIIGSGSASFEIIRDLVEKLPIMVAPKWITNLCQPIAIYDVVYYLTHVLHNPDCFNQTLEIGGPDVLTYRDMLYGLARERKLKRWIITIPILTPRLSSYWLYLVTSTNFFLARTLVDNLSTNFVCQDKRIQSLIPHECLSYAESIRRAFSKIEENMVVSSWHDALSSSSFRPDFNHYMQMPKEGCLSDAHAFEFTCDPKKVLQRIWRIGGDNGWYGSDPLWRIRGMIDRLLGGSGLRRGRRDPQELLPGDALDFWRVLVADKDQKRLLLYAEMKLPGQAWLEFRIEGQTLYQTAIFRPRGLFGRFYWYILLPFHKIIFPRMGKTIIKKAFEN